MIEGILGGLGGSGLLGGLLSPVLSLLETIFGLFSGLLGGLGV